VATSAEQLKDAVRAWLMLSHHLCQDGFYTFALEEESIKVGKAPGGHTAAGQVVVKAGGKGTITATLTFNPAGKLTAVDQAVKLRPGPRL
jgi:hypothetical protein